jgi:hypothetical protein
MRRRLRILLLVVVAGLLGVAVPATAQDELSAEITSPQEGAVLIGLVSIEGRANNASFQRYKIEFALQGEPVDQWFLLTEIEQQVPSGVLAQWNTTIVTDGVYKLRLRVVLQDGTILQAQVQNLRISNQQPTPLPTALQPATPVPPTVPPTQGPSPTPLIEQPPANTPRPEVVIPTSAPPPSSDTNDTPQIVFAIDALRNAFCSGVYLAIGFFVLIGVYSLIHSRVRPQVQRFMRQIRNELER